MVSVGLFIRKCLSHIHSQVEASTFRKPQREKSFYHNFLPKNKTTKAEGQSSASNRKCWLVRKSVICCGFTSASLSRFLADIFIIIVITVGFMLCWWASVFVSVLSVYLAQCFQLCAVIGGTDLCGRSWTVL